MANHASHAALPYPIKGARFSVLIPYLDADGDPTDPTTPDTEISKDDGAPVDTAEEVSSPKNSVGLLTLSGAEMDCSCASLAAKSASGPKTTLMTLFPRVLPVLTSGTAQAGAAGTITLASGAPAYSLIGAILKTTGGTGGGGTGGANNQARVITAYDTGTKVATVTPNWETTPDSTTTYEVLVTDMAANALSANLSAISGVAVATGTAQLGVNVVQISGDATAADNAESFFDGTGYKDVDNLYVLRSATAQAGAAGTITLDASASATDDFYNNTIIMIVSGTGAGQSRIISDYVGSTKVATVNGSWVINPSSDSVFIILPFGAIPGATAPTAGEVADAVWDEARSGHVTGGTFGEMVNANTIQISGDAAVADLLEAIFDETATVVHELGIVDRGTAQSASSTTLQLRAGFSAPSLVGATIHVWSSTNGLHQVRQVTQWNNSTKTATVDTFGETPSGTVKYVVFATAPASSVSPAPVNVTQWNGAAVAAPNVAGVPKVDVTHVVGGGTAGSNLGLMFDGSGYAGGTTKLGVNAVQVGGATPNAMISGRLDVSIGAYQAGLTPLQPTVAGRTLDVSTDGEAGVDWANVGGQSTTVALSATSIGSVAGAVASVTGNVGGNVVGNVNGSIGSLAAQAKADVNAEVVDVLAVDAQAEVTAPPAANAALAPKIGWLFNTDVNKQTLNKSTGVYVMRNRADSANIATRTDSDDGTTYTKGVET